MQPPRNRRSPSLPTFLCIGVPRGGTTWLHEVLRAHPEVWVPRRRKEVSFFDLYYDRGADWYQQFFPAEEAARAFRVLGEVTPYYLYGEDCPRRMVEFGIEKLVLMLRHPVDRAWSYYGQKIRNGMYRGEFEDFLKQTRWPVVEQGYYSRYVQRYLEHFDRSQLLVLVSEQALPDVATTHRTLASFLDVREDGFSPAAGREPVNASYVSRSPLLYGLAFRVSKVLRRYDLDWIVNGAKRAGLRELFGVEGKIRPMREETRTALDRLFAPEIDRLERQLGIPLDVWRDRVERQAAPSSPRGAAAPLTSVDE